MRMPSSNESSAHSRQERCKVYPLRHSVLLSYSSVEGSKFYASSLSNISWDWWTRAHSTWEASGRSDSYRYTREQRRLPPTDLRDWIAEDDLAERSPPPLPRPGRTVVRLARRPAAGRSNAGGGPEAMNDGQAFVDSSCGAGGGRSLDACNPLLARCVEVCPMIEPAGLDAAQAPGIVSGVLDLLAGGGGHRRPRCAGRTCAPAAVTASPPARTASIRDSCWVSPGPRPGPRTGNRRRAARKRRDLLRNEPGRPYPVQDAAPRRTCWPGSAAAAAGPTRRPPPPPPPLPSPPTPPLPRTPPRGRRPRRRLLYRLQRAAHPAHRPAVPGRARRARGPLRGDGRDFALLRHLPVPIRATPRERDGSASIRSIRLGGAGALGGALSWCPSCQTQLGEVTLPSHAGTNGGSAFDLTPYIQFIADRLDRLAPS